MKKIVLSGLCFFLLFSIRVVAAEDYCATWGCVGTVEELYTNANGNIYVATPMNESVANCTLHSGIYFVLNPNHQNSDKIYSTILAAYLSNSKIQLRIIEGSPDCEIAYVRLSTQF